MVDINLREDTNTTGHPTRRGRHVPYALKRYTVTGAAAAAAKGSALAAADVIQVANLPADTQVIGASLEVTVAGTGTASVADVSVGSVDFVSAADLTTAGQAAEAGASATVNAAGSLDIVLGTQTAAGDDWTVEVTAVIADVSGYPVPDQAKSATFL